MAKAKTYYWLKIPKEFWYSKEIKLLRRMPGGDTLVIIYLELLEEVANTAGIYYFEEVAGSLAEEIALEIDEKVEDVQMLLSFLNSKKLITELSFNEHYLEQIEELVGSETQYARQKRRQRNTVKVDNVHQVSTERPPHIELEKELEKEKELKLKQKSELTNYQSQNSNNHIGAFQYIESVTSRTFSAIAKDELLELINDFGNEKIVKKIKERNENDKFHGDSPVGVIRYIRSALENESKDKAKQDESDKKYNELFGDNVGEVSDDWME